ncbi:MAG: hypothetical protein VX660_01990, partial [Candidatus Thermoplasmatota archaeon]|nr:hypothetical protein [Candidatus Thermoplasmatota archaeon]
LGHIRARQAAQTVIWHLPGDTSLSQEQHRRSFALQAVTSPFRASLPALQLSKDIMWPNQEPQPRSLQPLDTMSPTQVQVRRPSARQVTINHLLRRSFA